MTTKAVPASLLLLVLSVTLAAQTLPPSPVTFETDAVSATVTPGATAVWLAAARGPTGYGTYVRFYTHIDPDTDLDGVVRWALGNPVDPMGLWVVADTSARSFVAGRKAYSETSKVEPIPFPSRVFLRDANGNFSHIQPPPLRSLTAGLLVLIRPGVGAWALAPAGIIGGRIPFEISAMYPVDNSPPPPAGVLPGDLFAAIEQYGYEWYGDRVDDHLGEAAGPGVIALDRFASPYPLMEDSGTATIRVVRIGGTDGEVTVPWHTEAGTALPGINFESAAGTLRFASGETEKVIAISLIDDAVFSGHASFDVVLESPAGAPIEGRSSITVTIQDDDPFPTLSWAVSGPQINEGNTGTTAVTASLVLTGSTRYPVTLDWAVRDSLWHSFGQGSVVFAPGETRKDVTITIEGDIVPEPDFTLDFVASHVTGAIAPPKNAIVQVHDEDDSFVSISDVSVEKGATEAVLRLTWSPVSYRPFSIRYRTRDGSAIAGRDYAAQDRVLLIDSQAKFGVTQISIPLAQNPNRPASWFAVDLVEATGAQLARSSAIVQLAGEPVETTPVIVSIYDATVQPGVTEAVLELTWAPQGAHAFSIIWRTRDGSALAGTDYVELVRFLSVGESEALTGIARISVPIIERARSQTSWFAVDLIEGTGATFDRSSGIVQIIGQPQPPARRRPVRRSSNRDAAHKPTAMQPVAP